MVNELNTKKNKQIQNFSKKNYFLKFHQFF